MTQLRVKDDRKGAKRLLDMVVRECSTDIRLSNRISNHIQPKDDCLPERSGPVATRLDLSQFTVYDSSKAGQRRGKWVRVAANGAIVFSNELGAHYESGSAVELMVNRKGTIIVVRDATTGKGLVLREDHPGRTKAKRTSCSALARQLQEAGIELPAKYRAAWDDELKAWVARL